jgi:hypothetical protein
MSAPGSVCFRAGRQDETVKPQILPGYDRLWHSERREVSAYSVQETSTSIGPLSYLRTKQLRPGEA